MSPAERAWTEARIAEWSERAAQWRRIACTRSGPLNRAKGLDSVVRRLQARLDAAGPAPVDEAPAPVTSTDPFAGTARERHLRSAAVCRKLGQEAAARAFEELADAPDRLPDARMPQPPARDPEPFTAGPQMEMFG